MNPEVSSKVKYVKQKITFNADYTAVHIQFNFNAIAKI